LLISPDYAAHLTRQPFQGLPEIGTILSVDLVAANTGRTFAKNLTMRAVIELITEKEKEPDFSGR